MRHYDNINLNTIAIEKCYNQEVIALLNYLDSRYTEIKQSGDKQRKKGIELLLDEILTVLEVEK